MSDSSKPRFTCPTCTKSFSRAEHLNRHSVIHNSSQSYDCEHCDKSFPRKDALSRHLSVHSSGPNLLEKKARACRACAKAKTRCTGENPCSRCDSKGINCVFPQSRPSQSASHNAMLASPGSETASVAMSSIGSISRRGTGAGNDEHLPAPTFDDNTTSWPRSPELSMSSHSPHTRRSLPVQDSVDVQRFDPAYWTPQMLSSINWLPINPSPVMGYEALLSPFNIAHSPVAYQQQATPATLENIPPIDNMVDTPRTLPSTTDSLGHNSNTSGEYYIEGNAGRLPKIKRQKIFTRRPSELRSQVNGWRLFWLPPITRDTTPVGRHFADFEYEAMQAAFLTLCVNCSPVMVPFVSGEFPPIETFDHLMHLYFKHIHPSTPFVHRPTFNPDHEGRWVLLLSMVSASCWFLDDETSDDFAESMLEFLRRVTLFFDSSNSWQKTFTNCRHAQIRLMFILSASASGHESVRAWSDRCMGEVCYLVNTAICQSYPKAQYERSGLPTAAEWIDWSEHEQTIRTAFLVWQVGLIRSMQNRDSRPPVTLDSIAQIQLPCTDDMFEAVDAESWQVIEAKHTPVTFQEALTNLYVDKTLVSNLGDLGHILLIYGIIQRTREVHDLVQQPMSLIEPSAERRRSSEMILQTDWAPNIPLYLKWRNSGCDCLDILHWQANAAIGLAGGLEPTKVMHLHFARVLMLVPLHDLLGLARLIDSSFRSAVASGTNPPEEMKFKRNIQRWAISDQYKARLAAIHAGVTFWHVRKYSTNAYYEPFAVLSATLTLWALSTFSTNVDIPAHSPDAIDGQESPTTSNIILIDRPTDDELVQQFVRDGRRMKVVMTGVEDLWSPYAPFRILKEGRRLLATLGAWSGEQARALSLLEGLTMIAAREV